MSKSRYFAPCLFFVVLCLLVSALMGWVTSHHIASWYEHLIQPSFRPPNWLFGPVWTVLYCLIGISGGVLWVRRHEAAVAWRFYILQLVFNFSWSFVFFAGQQIGWALCNIILLWLLIVCTMLASFKKARAVFWMFLPYLLWVSFATVLNISLWVLNA